MTMTDHPEPLISSEAVREAFRDCLYTQEQLEAADKDENGVPVGCIQVEGIMGPFGFNPESLAKHKDEVTAWLQALPLPFRTTENGGGGGWSFLNACQDANDVQWTGMHQTMNELFCLGIALDMAAWLMPRDMWQVFPGGMPYVVVKV